MSDRLLARQTRTIEIMFDPEWPRRDQLDVPEPQTGVACNEPRAILQNSQARGQGFDSKPLFFSVNRLAWIETVQLITLALAAPLAD